MCVSAAACTPDDPPADDAADAETGDGDGDGESGDDESDETGPPVFEPPEPECGNGYVEEGEQCDDGNLDDDDGCDSLCRIPCGMLWEATSPSPADDVSPVVADVAVGPEGELVVAGWTSPDTSEAQGDVWLGVWSSEGEPLWSGVYDLVEGRNDRAAAVAVAPDGAVYLSATVRVPHPDITDGTAIWVGRFDDLGELVWSATMDNPLEGAKDVASGLAITPLGNVVVAGNRRVGDGDSDLWIAELSPTDGAVQWSSTWSGALAPNGFSLDKGGPVAIGSDGTIWATAIEYVNFDTFDVHVLSFDPTGALLGDWAPQADVATAHNHQPTAITVQADGSVYFSITRLGPASHFWLHRLEPSAGGAAGEITWIREAASFVDVGQDWNLNGVAAAPDGQLFVGGALYRKETEDNWYEGWVHRLDGDGQALCTTRHTSAGATILTPNLFVTAIGASAAGDLVAAGHLLDVENARSFWVGSFRGL